MEAKHRPPRTYSLRVTGRARKAINRNYFNSYVWKPALAAVIVSLARRLGHFDPGFTLRKYSQFLPRTGARGSAAIDAIFA